MQENLKFEGFQYQVNSSSGQPQVGNNFLKLKKTLYCWVYARSRLFSAEAKTFSSLCLLFLVVLGLYSYAYPLHCKIEEYIFTAA